VNPFAFATQQDARLIAVFLSDETALGMDYLTRYPTGLVAYQKVY
jgi:hypothetical protein